MPLRDVGDAVRTQRSGGQPEYESIRAACNRLAQLFTCTYLLQRRCESGARPSLTAPRHSLREALYCACVSLVVTLYWSVSTHTYYVIASYPGRAFPLQRGLGTRLTTSPPMTLRLPWQPPTTKSLRQFSLKPFLHFSNLPTTVHMEMKHCVHRYISRELILIYAVCMCISLFR